MLATKPIELCNSILTSGVKLFCLSDSEDGQPRIHLSSGTQPAANLYPEFRGYISDAVVPKEPWREPSIDELQKLIFPEPLQGFHLADIGSAIGIVRFPREALEPLQILLEETGLSAGHKAYGGGAIYQHPRWQDCVNHLKPFVAAYDLSHQSFSRFSRLSSASVLQASEKTKILNLAPPGLWTSTLDLANHNSSYVGLHLDSWDCLPLRRRHQSRNRICINLGREDRYFLLFNLTLMQMFQKLGYSDQEVYKHYRGTNIGQEFMLRYPDYPVTRLKLAPGEAYIAPTDNMIHDASTLGQHYLDITLVFIGFFGLPDQLSAPNT
uniref:Uncharacterized protein n=1 Tax=Cyanothece sp. (strain PCC 7425 / ATCC 29141) TaxID=395961 RepID=B8HRD8_CYAP4